MMLGDLIKTLGQYAASRPVKNGFGRPHSYRGIYAELAFEPKQTTTVGEMLAGANDVLGAVLNGYKGGEYTMHEFVDVYLANYGDTGEMLSAPLLFYMLGDNEAVARWWDSPLAEPMSLVSDAKGS